MEKIYDLIIRLFNIIAHCTNELALTALWLSYYGSTFDFKPNAVVCYVSAPVAHNAVVQDAKLNTSQEGNNGDHIKGTYIKPKRKNGKVLGVNS